MSVRKVTEHLSNLSTRGGQWTKDDVVALREAAGPKLSTRERSLVDSFIRDHRPELTFHAKTMLQEDFRLNVTPPVSLSLLREESMDIREGSAVVALGEDKFLIADDETGIYLHERGMSPELLIKSKKTEGMNGLEGMCLSEDKSTVYAISEDSRKVFSMSLDNNASGVSLGTPELMGKLKAVGKYANKGWEGIDILPGRFSEDGQDRILAVNEGYPKVVGIFSMPDLEMESLLSLPKDVDAQMRDVSDITVDPQTGHLFLLSDESSNIAELELATSFSAGPGALLEGQELQTIATFEVPQEPGRKAEGLSFNEDGSRLFVATEGVSSLLEYKVDR